MQKRIFIFLFLILSSLSYLIFLLLKYQPNLLEHASLLLTITIILSLSLIVMTIDITVSNSIYKLRSKYFDKLMENNDLTNAAIWLKVNDKFVINFCTFKIMNKYSGYPSVFRRRDKTI